MFAYDFTFFDQFPLNILVIWKYGSFIVDYLVMNMSKILKTNASKM